MSVRAIHGSKWVDFRFQGTRYRKKSPINTVEGAKQYEAALIGRLMRGDPVEDPPARTLTFAAFAEEWFDTYVTTNNKPTEQRAKRLSLRNHLLPVFGQVPLDRIDTVRIEQFKRSRLAEGLKPKTVNNHLAILRRALVCAQEWGVLERLPRMKPLRVDPPATPVLTDDESLRLLNAPMSPTTHAMILTALRTGLRLGELSALRWSDVDLDRAHLIVSRSVVRGIVSSPKSNRIRRVPMTRDLVEELRTLPRRHAELVFPGDEGGMLTGGTADRNLRRACQGAGLAPCGWHRLRHTFASQCYNRGVLLPGIKAWLGHSTIAMTERYTHFAASAFDDAIHVLEPDYMPCLGNGRATAPMVITAMQKSAPQ